MQFEVMPFHIVTFHHCQRHDHVDTPNRVFTVHSITAYICSEQSTPGDPYDYHDPCGGLNPDTPYVRGYSASDTQWQGGLSGGAGKFILNVINIITIDILVLLIFLFFFIKIHPCNK